MAIIVGSSAAENLVGTSQNDFILGLQGSDTIAAGAGSDLVDGGAGNDSVNGGAGGDIVFGGAGNDTLDGGAGIDILFGGDGKDVLIYNVNENLTSFDVYDGGSGQDTLRILVSQAFSQQANFIADIARLNARLASGNGSYSFQSIGITVLSIEKLEVVVQGAANQAPIAVADTVSAVEDTGLVILKSILLANDTDADAGDTRTLVSVQGAQNGTVSLNAAGDVVFLAAANFSGVASFTYTIRDTAGATSTATVTVNVAAVADAPTLTVQAASGVEDSAIALDIASALGDTDGSETLAIIIAGVPAAASLNNGIRNADGSYSLARADLAGLTLTPPASFAGNLSLTVTATSRETSNGATASTSASLMVSIAAAADAPSLVVVPATGGEDLVIALSIDSALADADGSETLAITITGVPVGASLNNGVRNPDGSYALSATDLAGLLLTPPANLAGAISLGVTATSRETSNGAAASASATLAVSIAAAADAPSLAVAPASGDEDTAIALTIASALTDTDGSETLAITITGLPAGASLNRGIAQPDGSYTLTAGELTDLRLTPPGDFSGDITLTVTATSREASSGGTADTSTTLLVSVSPVADAAAITLSPATGDTSAAAIPLAIAVATTDPSETFGAIRIAGVPDGYALNVGNVDAAGVWTLTQAQLAGVALIPEPDARLDPGGFTLTVSATTIDGASTAVSSTPLLVTIAAAADQSSGLVIDGYIAGATVFKDANGNGVLDPGEARAITNASGGFTITGGSGNLVMFGGIDTSTGAAFAGVLKAPAGSTVVTPLTTLVAAIGGDVEAAQAAVKASLGLDSNVDLTTYDAVAATVAGDANGAAVLGAAVQVQATVTQIAAATGGALADVVAALAETLNTATVGVDLTDPATLGTLVTTVVPDATPAAVTQVSAVIAAANLSVADAVTSGDALDNIAQAAQVALGATTQALASAGLDTTALDSVVTSFTGPALAAEVAAAPVADVDGPTLGTLGADTLGGSPGVDAVDGLGGSDSISSGEGNDLLYGGPGTDTLRGGTGDDRIDGGTGFDRAYYTDADAAITVSLTTGLVTGGAGADTLVSVEGARGTAFADSFSAAGYTSFTGYASGRNDQGSFNEFQGMGGDDTFVGNGNTRISYFSAAAAVSVNFVTGIATGAAPGDLAQIGTDSIGAGVNQVRGSAFDDTIIGSPNGNLTADVLDGAGGNDLLDGNQGFDRVRYDLVSTGALGITVNLAAGIVTGRDAAATAVVGTDTLRSIESVFGSNAADIFDATGFTGPTVTVGAPSVNNGGDQGNFAEFEGKGGDDTLIGNGASRIGFSSAAGAVLVDMSASVAGAGAGIATGDSSVGTDTFTGVLQIRGSNFADTFIGSNNGNNTTEQFEGMGGDDSIHGGLGFDRARFDSNLVPAGISFPLGVTIVMASGLVTGRDATASTYYGTDTLRSIEAVRGTIAADVYDARDFGATGFLDTLTNNVGNNGTFNEFEGVGGDDSIIGNGNTRIAFNAAAQSVIVDLAAGRVFGGASVGTDTISGISQVSGSGFADTIIGNATNTILTGANGNDSIAGGSGSESLGGGNGDDTLSGGSSNDSLTGDAGNDSLIGDAGNEFLSGGTGDDSFDGAGGADVVIYGGFTRAQAAITNLGGGVLQVTMPDGTDRLSNVEVLRFNDGAILASAAVSLVGRGGIGTNVAIFGSGGADVLTIDTGTNGNPIDLGAGTDTLILGATNGIYTSPSLLGLALSGIEIITGSATNDALTVGTTQTGIAIDLGAGSDTLSLTAFGNTGTIRNVESVTTGGGNDIVTVFQSTDQAATAIDLGAGTDSLTLAANGTGATTVSVRNTETILGSVANDAVTLASPILNASIDLAGGTNSVILGAIGVVSYSLALANVASVTDLSGATSLILLNGANGLSVNLGSGADTLGLAGTGNTITVSNAETLNAFGAGNDVVNFIPDAAIINQGVNLGTGIDVLNIQGSNGTLSMSISGGSGLTVSLQTTALNESLNLLTQQTGATYDFGAGGADRLSLNGLVNTLTTRNLELLTGSSGDDAVTFVQDPGGSNATIDLGGGTDRLYLGAGDNNVTVTGAEFVFGAGTSPVGASGTSNDVIFYTPVPGLSSVSTLSLGGGTDVVNIVGAGGAFFIPLAVSGGSNGGSLTVNFATGALNEAVLLTQSITGATFDFGAGLSDQLGLANTPNFVTVRNTEFVSGGSFGDSITVVGNNAFTTSVRGGANGANAGDTMTGSAGTESFVFNAVGDSPVGGARDVIIDFDAGADRFSFSSAVNGVPTGFFNPISFIGTGAFGGGGSGHPEARLTNLGGLDVLEIDFNGDGTISAGDMEIQLNGLIGTLSNVNFLII